MRKLSVILSTSAILISLLLSACGEFENIAEVTATPTPVVELSCGSFPSDINEISAVISESDMPLLDGLMALKKADFSGSTCSAAIAKWQSSHPELEVLYTVELPDGSQISSGTSYIEISLEDSNAMLDVLPLLNNLQEVKLDDSIQLDVAAQLAEAAPAAMIDYNFSIYGVELSAKDEEINLSHIPVDDNGDDVILALSIMRNCKSLDMDSCGLSDERMANIRDSFPEVKVVWRIWFGGSYSVRTDVKRILASSTYPDDQLRPDNTQSLKYCTELTHLDLGHNPELTDVSFLAYMPKLQVLILALDGMEDISAIANCTEIEYLEIYWTPVNDISALKNLKKLRHLNIGGDENLSDISPIYGLTELERLWIGRYTPVPEEQVEIMQAAAPNCEINLTCWDAMDGGWRFLSINPDVRAPRYLQLIEEFHYKDGLSAYAYGYNDPLY